MTIDFDKTDALIKSANQRFFEVHTCAGAVMMVMAVMAVMAVISVITVITDIKPGRRNSKWTFDNLAVLEQS